MVGGQEINDISQTKYRQPCWPGPGKHFLPLAFKTKLIMWKTSTNKRLFHDNIAFTKKVLWAIFSQD